MRNIVKRRNPQIRIIRNQFKNDLYKEMESNKGLAIAIINTYTSWKHRTHIHKIWELLGFNHKEAYKDYCDKLMGKHLTGNETIWKTLYFGGCEDLRSKYSRKIPEVYAMGDALGVAYKILK